jgi:hypothetical protein
MKTIEMDREEHGVEENRGNSAALRVHEIDPLTDSRWSEFIAQDPRATVFHTAGWLKALQTSYGYRPLVYTASPAGTPLKNGVLFCDVKSWATGRRLVSLPFSDHCEPLVESKESLQFLLSPAREALAAKQYKYIEVRPLSLEYTEAGDSETYFLHLLDLRPALDELYKKLHGDSIRRKIQRAEREKLTLEEGSSEPLLADFYKLHMLTRQRQELPPHPLTWFRNVLASLGTGARIRIAKKDGATIAAIFTVGYKQKMVYKYGCSDAHSHNLGGMQFLFWNLIRDAKENGFVELDFGRSDCDNAGLVTFKDRWGTKRQQITYLRYPPRRADSQNNSSALMKLGKKVFAHCPQSVLRVAGNLLYPHAG